MFFGDALAYIGDLAGTDSGVKENYFICMNVFYPDHESENETWTQAAIHGEPGVWTAAEICSCIGR